MINKIIIILFFLSSIVHAADYQISSQMIGSSPTSVALGTSIFSNEVSSLFESDVLEKNRLSVSLFNVKTMGDFDTTVVAAGFGFKNLVIAAGIASSGTTGIEITTETGLDNEIIPTGETYNYTNAHYKGALTYYLADSFAMGVGVSYFNSQMYNTAGSGMNVSVSSKFKFSEKIDVGLTMDNILSGGVEFENETENLPMQMLFSTKYQVTEDLEVIGTLKNTASELNYESDQLLSMGAQYKLFKQLQINAVLFQEYAGLEVKNNIAVGTSLKLNSITFNYAYKTVEYTEAADQHFFSVSINI